MVRHIIDGDLKIIGDLRMDSALLPKAIVFNANVHNYAGITRAKLGEEELAIYSLDFADFRVWDAFDTNLPYPGANDDLGMNTYLITPDMAGDDEVTMYARTMFALPAEYVAGGTVVVRLHCGMELLIADIAATVNVQVYKSNRETGVGSNLSADGAQSMNTLLYEDRDFTVSAAGLSPGDMLDIRLAMLVNDAETPLLVYGIIGSVDVLCDIKG